MFGVPLFEIFRQTDITLHMAIVSPNFSFIYCTVLVAAAWHWAVSLLADLAVAGCFGFGSVSGGVLEDF